ncbi:MAG: hypothetical protein GY937_28060 [bacterium]|nr:hypothetical protein [bacterium]
MAGNESRTGPDASLLASPNGFLLELAALVAILVGGAVLRYWLSTVIPFDGSEFELLSEASHRDRAMRAPFAMMNGASLFCLYLLIRKAAGPEATIAGLLVLQTSMTFQEQALRINWLAVPVLISMMALTYWRLMRPSRQLPQRFAYPLLILAALLGIRGLYLGVTLPARMNEIRTSEIADPEILFDSLVACGGDIVTSLETLAGCDLAWPEQRSLEQQEALLGHAQLLGADAIYLDGNTPIQAGGHQQMAVYDPGGVGFLAVPDGPLLEIALRRVRAEAVHFFEGR